MKVKAIKIDVVAKTVTEIEITPNLQGLYDGTGAGVVEHVSLSLNGDDLYIDEEGRLKEDQPGNFVFDAGTPSQTVPFVGNGLIVGRENSDEKMTDVKSTVDQIQKRVTFTEGRQEPEFAFFSEFKEGMPEWLRSFLS